MNSALFQIPLLAFLLVLVAILLLDLALGAESIIYWAFLPVLIWLGVIAAKGRV